MKENSLVGPNRLSFRWEIDEGRKLRLHKILVPLDLTEGSREALFPALALARTLHASVVVLHVVQLNIAGEEFGIPRTRLVYEIAEEARAKLRLLMDSIGELEIFTENVVVEGRPHVEILHQASKLKADLIVMAGKRYVGPSRLLHPHTLVRVLRNASCPVLVVQAHRAHSHRSTRFFFKRIAYRCGSAEREQE